MGGESLANEGDETGRHGPDGRESGELTLDEEPKHQDQHTLRHGCTDTDCQQEDERQNDNAHTVSIGRLAPKTSLPSEDFPEGEVRWTASGRDACPDAAGGFDQHSGADQSVHDPGSRFRGDLQGIA